MLEYHETNDLALSLRRQWGIDDYSPIDIFSLALEKIKNLTIIWMKMDKDISGACSKNDGDSVTADFAHDVFVSADQFLSVQFDAAAVRHVEFVEKVHYRTLSRT